jgi:ankyrin repeat protein
MIEWDEYLAKAGFGELHKIVCNVNDRDLEREILARPEEINRLDKDFKSPLYYASMLLDIAKVRILLKHGADPNASNKSILFAQIRHRASETMKSLLIASAWIPALNESHVKNEAYHADAYNLAKAWWEGQPSSNKSYDEIVDESCAIDRLLITHGLDLNYQDMDGDTFLMALATYSGRHDPKVRRIRLLLEYNADIELSNNRGLRAIHCSMSSLNGWVFEILAKHGAQLDAKRGDGSTILHLAVRDAKHSSLIEVMLEQDLSSIHLNARDFQGLTAFALLKMRAGRRRDQYQAFPKLISEEKYFGWWGCTPEMDCKIIGKLDFLLRRIEDTQCVPVEERYPPLFNAAGFVEDDGFEDDKDGMPSEQLPGTWPEEL